MYTNRRVCGHFATSCDSLNQTLVDKATYGGDRLAIRHDATGVTKEQATSMEEARGKA